MTGIGMDMEKQFDAIDKADQLHRGLKMLAGDMPPSMYKDKILDLIGEVACLQDVIAPEEVRVDSSPAEDGSPGIGWVMMGGLSVSLTRSTTDGKLVVLLENTVNDADNEKEIPVRVEFLSGGSPDSPIWEGVVL